MIGTGNVNKEEMLAGSWYLLSPGLLSWRRTSGPAAHSEPFLSSRKRLDSSWVETSVSQEALKVEDESRLVSERKMQEIQFVQGWKPEEFLDFGYWVLSV
mmetsp:Transcript_761/g.1622  ORF Transcript_761/g.1622 Transcript_761/m.1622 type:complete len:100 (+) Transcript_761:1491-1790(+)